MKYVSKIAAMLSLGALLASSAAFAAKTGTDVRATAGRSAPETVSTPLTVVAPRAIVDLNEEIRLAFTANEAARPAGVVGDSAANDEIVDSVKRAGRSRPPSTMALEWSPEVELPARFVVASN